MVSFFAGRGKRTAWEVWTSLPELTQVLIDLTTAPAHVDEDATQTIERFIILLYDRKSMKKNVQLMRPSSSMSEKPCTRAGMSGASTASCTSTALPDRLELGQDERADVRVPLDITP